MTLRPGFLLATTNRFRFHDVVPGAALCMYKPHEYLQRTCVRLVPEECSLAPHVHHTYMLQLFEMMRQRRIRNLELAADIANDQAVRMSREQQSHDSQPRLRTHRCKHV